MGDLRIRKACCKLSEYRNTEREHAANQSDP